MQAMKLEADEMACTNPAEMPEESRFSLALDGVKNSNKSIAYHAMN